MYLYIYLYLSVCTLTRYNLFLSFIRKYNHFFYKALSEFDSSCWTEWEEKSDNQKVYFIVPNTRVIWEYLRCPWGFLAIRLIELFLDWSLSHCRSHDPRCPVNLLCFPIRHRICVSKGGDCMLRHPEYCKAKQMLWLRCCVISFFVENKTLSFLVGFTSTP